MMVEFVRVYKDVYFELPYFLTVAPDLMLYVISGSLLQACLMELI